MNAFVTLAMCNGLHAQREQQLSSSVLTRLQHATPPRLVVMFVLRCMR
jgi:hypothetical protein